MSTIPSLYQTDIAVNRECGDDCPECCPRCGQGHESGVDCPACPDAKWQALLDGRGERRKADYLKWQKDTDLYGPLSEASLAEWFYRSNHGLIAYDYDLDQWREWLGGGGWGSGYWRNVREITEPVLHHISNALGVRFDAATATDAKRWLSRSTVNAVIELAKHKFARRCEWDADANRIGLPNGYYLDTDTGDIECQSWQDYISRNLPDGIDGGGDDAGVSKRFDNFVFDCLEHYPPADRFAVKDFLQEWAGSALTGDCRDELAVFLYGPRGTGKSVYTETIAACMGVYGATVSGNRVARDNNQHPQWLAGLQGKRLVYVHELPDSGRWQSEYLNTLIDGGTVEANRMRQDSINFRSVAHVIATGNHRPSAPSSDGIWRRLAVVQFRHVPDVPDTNLKADLLRNELPGVFVWLLEGLNRWIDNGRKLTIPEVLKQDTAGYEADSDPVRQFVDDCLIIAPGCVVGNADLYAAFTEWWEANQGGKVMTPNRLSRRLTDMGLPSSSPMERGTKRGRIGVGLLAGGTSEQMMTH